MPGRGHWATVGSGGLRGLHTEGLAGAAAPRTHGKGWVSPVPEEEQTPGATSALAGAGWGSG